MGVVDEADGEALGVAGAEVGEIGMAGEIGREQPNARGSGMRWAAGGTALAVVAAAAWWSGAGNGDSREIPVHAGADGALITGERTPNSGPGDFNRSNGSSHMKIQTVISSAMLCSVVGVAAGLANPASGEGVVRCWGWNNFGQCDVPSDLGVVRQISAGGYFTLAVRQDGTVRCWGQNDDGQCNVPADLGAVRQVVAGGYHVIALRQDNTVRCWGRNDYGQINVPSDLQAVMQVAGGGFITAVVEYNGTARCWGRNDDGQCNVPADLGTVVQMTAGRGHTFARRTDGSLRGWGRNDYGQCNVPADVTTAIQVAATGDHTVALQPDGSVRCWGTGSADTGSNPNYGQSIVPSDLGLVDQVAAEGYSTMALRRGGTVRCWGYNKFGECNVPTDLVDVIQIAGGGHHNVAISATDQPVQWRVEDGGNGHWYVNIRLASVISWSAARQAAEALGGYLACPTTQTENEWVWSNIVAPVYTGWDGWIGLYQVGGAEPNGGWRWITGEPADYFAWCGFQPDNSGPEDFGNYHGNPRCWNDMAENGCYFGECLVKSYLIEWSADCNNDNIVDYGQILTGQLADTNTNGIPDCCEPGNNCCVGDIYENHIVDGGDLGVLLSEWGIVTPTTHSDLNRDGFVNGADLGMLLANWGPCGG